MAIRVLVVEDSNFIRKRIIEILQEDPDLKVVGSAANGEEAIKQTLALRPDVITMDIAMPVMDGVSAVRAIMRQCPTRILMLSAATRIGAQATMDALAAGAADFMPKQFDGVDAHTARAMLRARVKVLGTRSVSHESPPAKVPSAPRAAVYRSAKCEVLVIAASTGGPLAIQKILTQMPAEFRLPIVLIQHMPPQFTLSFAERLDHLCRIQVKQAEQGDVLRPGLALLAPGGYQLEIERAVSSAHVELRRARSDEHYSPSADVTLMSFAKYYGKSVLALILTGMGADGKKGAESLKRGGSTVWAQSQRSCTVYGMPKAVIDASLADRIYDLDDFALELRQFVNGHA